jgi:hypothetical protein
MWLARSCVLFDEQSEETGEVEEAGDEARQ